MATSILIGVIALILSIIVICLYEYVWRAHHQPKSTQDSTTAKPLIQIYLDESFVNDEVIVREYFIEKQFSTTLIAFDGDMFVLKMGQTTAISNFAISLQQEYDIILADTDIIIPVHYSGRFTFKFPSVEKRREEKALREAEILAQTVKDCNILPNNTDL